LTLTDPAKEVLLMFLGTGKGGLKANLTLRIVCKTTKEWIENLSLQQQKRVFSTGKIVVELEKQNIKSFVTYPPPFPITTLSLTRLGYLQNHTFTLEEEQTWSRFLDFWTCKLESLEIDNVCLPLPQRALELISGSSSLLKSVHISSIWLPQTITTRIKVPDFMMTVENLSINCLIMTDREKQSFYNQISNNNKLKQLTVNLSEEGDLEGLINVIEAKRDDPKFQLTFRLKTAPWKVNLDEDDGYRRLVHSVTSSLSKIRLLEVGEQELMSLKKIVGVEEGRKFLSCVESIICLP